MKNTVLFGIIAVVIVGGVVVNAVMQNKTAGQKKIETSAVQSTVKQSTQLISFSDVRQHNTPGDCWTVIEGKVYDLTAFIAKGQHPPSINEGCGADGTDLFNTRGSRNSPHPQQAVEMLKSMYKGDLRQ